MRIARSSCAERRSPDGVPASVLVHRGDGPPRPRAYTRAMRVTVAMGAFNEAPNVAIVVTDALSAIAETGGDGGGPVVDDGSTHGPAAILDDLMAPDTRGRAGPHATNPALSGAGAPTPPAARGGRA